MDPQIEKIKKTGIEFEPDRGVWGIRSSRITRRAACYIDALEYQPIWSYFDPNREKLVSKTCLRPHLGDLTFSSRVLCIGF